MGLSFTIAAGSRQRTHSQVRVPRDSQPHFVVSDSRLPQPGGSGPRIYISQEQREPVMPSDTGLLFSSSPTARRATRDILNPPQISLNCRANCLQDNSSALTTQKTQRLCCCRDVFTAPLYSNGRRADHIEMTVLLLSHSCKLRAVALWSRSA
jgi:hypothetical protein